MERAKFAEFERDTALRLAELQLLTGMTDDGLYLVQDVLQWLNPRRRALMGTLHNAMPRVTHMAFVLTASLPLHHSYGLNMVVTHDGFMVTDRSAIIELPMCRKPKYRYWLPEVEECKRIESPARYRLLPDETFVTGVRASKKPRDVRIVELDAAPLSARWLWALGPR